MARLSSRARTEFALALAAAAVIVVSNLSALGIGAKTAAGETLYVRTAQLNLRERPEAAVLDRLACGEAIRIETAAGDWVKGKVARSGLVGWVNRSYLAKATPACGR